MPMTRSEIARTRFDAILLRAAVKDIEDIKRRHPEYHGLQAFDTTELTMVASNLDDDADQEERIAADVA